MKLTKCASLLFVCVLSFNAFAQGRVHKQQSRYMAPFDSVLPPAAPDYGDIRNWAALPFRTDAADGVPRGVASVPDSVKQADVFYIHPTTYRQGDAWNADIHNDDLNKQVDDKPIKYQASAWNGTCRVYAPRYRQAVLRSFFTDKRDGKEALDLAYEDVKRAFQYYLDHYNQGRPIVIASHSQGSLHARRLLKEFFDKGALRNKLVCAYVIGYPTQEKNYENLKACHDETQTGCIVSWASYKEGFEPEGKATFYKDEICVNPITWRTDTVASQPGENKGMVLLNFRKLIQHRVSARIHDDILWVKVDYPLARSLNNLHIADINLFWADIRQDVEKRLGYFLKR